MEISRRRLRTRLAGVSALCLAAFTLSPGPAWGWEPSPGGETHLHLVGLAREITQRSILDGDSEPLLEALPDDLIDSARKRERWRDRLGRAREELLERLGPFHEWEMAEVLTDERGQFKVRVRFYRAPGEPGSKRFFRGVSFIFSPRGRRFCLTYMASWDPVTGTWNVLG